MNIKWSGKNYELELNLNEPALLFKSQLFELTGVPVDRQKIMIKGGMLKDDTDLSKIDIKAVRNMM